MGPRYLIAVALAGASVARAEAPADAHRAEVESYRAQRQKEIDGDEGWLTIAGLSWLAEGANRAGADPRADVVLPAGTAPPNVGVFELRGGAVTFRAAPGAGVTLNGAPVTEAVLASGATPDVLALGRLRFWVIVRGTRHAVRVRHLDAPARAKFTGLTWFPVRERYRVLARFVPYDPPRPLAVPNVLGEVNEQPSPGCAVFTLDGREHRLEPVLEGPDKLFFIFRDATAGAQTYPAGRFLYADLAKDGTVVLDFNKAVNPPCAFTAFATCPLPPAGNRLNVRIEAGETWHGH